MVLSTLFKEAEQLDNNALDSLITRLQSIRAYRRITDRQKTEVQLLKKINRTLNSEQLLKFQALNQKRLSNEIDETEMLELQELLGVIEKLHVERIKFLGQLALLRNTTVKELFNELNLNPIING